MKDPLAGLVQSLHALEQYRRNRNSSFRLPTLRGVDLPFVDAALHLENITIEIRPLDRNGFSNAQPRHCQKQHQGGITRVLGVWHVNFFHPLESKSVDQAFLYEREMNDRSPRREKSGRKTVKWKDLIRKRLQTNINRLSNLTAEQKTELLESELARVVEDTTAMHPLRVVNLDGLTLEDERQ
jgi:hypothetical protein